MRKAMAYKKSNFIVRVVLAIFALSVFAVLISLWAGSARIPFGEILGLLAERFQGHETASQASTILFNIRIPRILMGFIIGGALSLAGVIFQALFRNPLVEPYTLGISGGASLATSILILCGYSSFLAMPVVGFLGAAVSVFVVHIVGKRCRNLGITGLLLAGVMFSFICSSLVMFILSVVKSEDAHSILFWVMGNLEQNNPVLLTVIAVVISLAALISFTKAWELNVLVLGDEEARHLGIDPDRERRNLFIIASIFTGVAVSVSGIIGFVGLVIPHFMRRFTGADHRILMPASFLIGGVFLILCDTVARTVIAPVQLPVGVITGLIGGSVFLYFLTRGVSSYER